MTILGNWTDLNLGRVIGSENRRYFTQSELASFSFTAEDKSDAPVYTDYLSSYYINRGLGISRASAAIFRVSSEKECYFLLREEELWSRGVLPFTTKPAEGFMGAMYYYRPAVDPSPEPIWQEGAKIYDNRSVVIYYLSGKSGTSGRNSEPNQ